MANKVNMDYRILDTPQAVMTGGCINMRISRDISGELYFSDFSSGRIPRLRYHWHWHWQWSRTFTMLTVHHTAVPTEPNKSFKISPLYFQECAVVLTTDVWHNWHRGVILKHAPSSGIVHPSSSASWWTWMCCLRQLPSHHVSLFAGSGGSKCHLKYYPYGCNNVTNNF